ncbi:hypothetical protein NQ318_020326 [Aromia moschata]|uniref:Uncharacterized protein n=1 Tax=Aromia moschata TaxID=1265417 RepID=A0AAV8XE10_9CUCU|nr:hypothetical protein NQ318_020326 [Aromia moschata]
MLHANIALLIIYACICYPCIRTPLTDPAKAPKLVYARQYAGPGRERWIIKCSVPCVNANFPKPTVPELVVSKLLESDLVEVMMEKTLEQRYAVKFCVNLNKTPKDT